MIQIQIQKEFIACVTEDSLKKTVQAVLADQQVPVTSDLSIVVSDDAQLQTMNLQYRGINAPTDVLSFSDGEIDPDNGHIYLGDILISYPRALSQAQSEGHAVDEEMRLLVVHGVLHLLGYDHGDAQEKTRMWQIQREILKAINCPLDPA